jgi:hypothetical protein
MENVGILYDHLVYFEAIWYILMSICYVLWLNGIFFPFWYVSFR